MKRIGVIAIAALVLGVFSSSSATAYANGVAFTGQGLIADGFGGYDLRTEVCGAEADREGPYLLWVLTATKATKADITGPWNTTEEMTKISNGTFKYVSDWYDPNVLMAANAVVASYEGASKNPQLVVSHGCRPFTNGAWCSPGFWKGAKDGAWTLVGKSKSDYFNTTVYDYFYGAAFSANPTLGTVLGDASTYSGPPLAGTSGYALNAFNATGAYLTNLIPGYQFDLDVMVAGGSDACPIDHFGHFKTPS